MDGWLINTSHPRCDGRARARPRAWRMTAPPSIQPLPSVLTCTLLAFSQLFHRQAEDLGQRVTKEEVEGPAWPRGSSLPRWGNLFTTSSSLGKLLKQLAFTKKKKKKVLSSAYLRLMIFLPAILIPACASYSPAFLMMYSAYKLNKQGDNIQP